MLIVMQHLDGAETTGEHAIGVLYFGGNLELIKWLQTAQRHGNHNRTYFRDLEIWERRLGEGWWQN